MNMDCGKYGVWKTKCGLYVNPEEHRPLFDGSCSYMGVEYCVENDNVLIHCPYNHDEYIGMKDCDYREKGFDDCINGLMYGMCCVSKTDEPYDYELSIEKVNDDNDAKYLRNLKNFKTENPLYEGCACIKRYGNDVKIDYQLNRCLVWHNGCPKPVCAVTGKERNLTLVNIYCDIKLTADKGTLFEHEVIRKGIKLTKNPIVKECADRKLKEYEKREAWEWRNYGILEVPFRFYIKKGSAKDLMQDLQDAAEGFEVIHDSDLKKKAKAEKSERRKWRKEKRIQKLWKRWRENGDPLARKILIRKGELDGEIDVGWIPKSKAEKPESKNEQLSLFDTGEM